MTPGRKALSNGWPLAEGKGMKSLRQFTTLLLFLFMSTGLFAQTTKIAPDLQAILDSPKPPATIQVVVQFQQTDTLTALTDFANKLGGQTHRTYEFVPMAVKTLQPFGIKMAAYFDFVTYISLDRSSKGTLATATDYANVATGANTAASYGYTGKGVGVAIIDSGISDHGDLASKVVYRESFVGGVNKDDYGHGTHVAGVVAGSGAASKGAVHGIAPGVNLLDLRVLDADGMSTDGAIIAALDRAVKLKEQFNIRVINLSVGRQIYESYTSDPLTVAVETATKRGNPGRSGGR
jgi:serine protease AprX